MMLTVALAMALGTPVVTGTFKSDQQRFQRVRTAYSDKEADMKALFAHKKL